MSAAICADQATDTAVYRTQRAIDAMCPQRAGWRRTWRGAYVTWTRHTLAGPQRFVADRGHVTPGSFRVNAPAGTLGWRVRPLGAIPSELRGLVVSAWT